MPKNEVPENKVDDIITDQEIAFACLVLSGTMSDREAAQTAGLNPDSAAYIKAKPCVRAYMIEHRAAVERKLVELEAEEIRQRNIGREQVLRRLWDLANISPEITRGSITGQVKAISMIVAIEGLIPDRRARSSSAQRAAANQPAPVVPSAPYQADSIPEQQSKTTNPEPAPSAPHQAEAVSVAQPEPEPAPVPVADAPQPPRDFPWVNRIPSSEIKPLESYPQDTRPLSVRMGPFRRR